LSPLDLKRLIDSKFWEHFYQPSDYLWQDTMFQPIGGMDKIVTAFQREIGDRFGSHVIQLEAKVTKVELRDDASVAVTFRQGVRSRTKVANYCVSTIPLPVLKDIKMVGFSSAFRTALSTVGFAKTCKVGWQANQRFWEEKPDEIYGGISWTDHNITQLWYPSNGYFSANGTLTGAYNYDDQARDLGNMSLDMRLQHAREGAAELHEQFEDETIVPTAKGISIAWHKVPYQLGGWAAWDPTDSKHMAAYTRLLQPEGNFYFAGDQASPLPGWMEGAMMSAHYVIEQMAGAIELTVADSVRVPDSVALTQGLV
jgi:monoamine oxidase